MLEKAAFAAANTEVEPFKLGGPYEITIRFALGSELLLMKQLHPELFVDDRTIVMRGDSLLKTWAEYLVCEKELNEARKKA